MMRRARRRRGGFTLLELLAVVALLGIVLFVIVPKLDNITPGARLKAAARKIGSTMELAQGQAIATGKEYTLAYDLDKGTYWLILPPPDDPNAANQDPATKTILGPPETTTDPNNPAPPPLDVEHDPKPAVTTPAPSAGSTTGTATPAPPKPTTPASPANYQGRDTGFEDSVGDDIQIASISFPTQQEVTSGVIYVTFSSLGNEGSHAVFLKLRGQNGVESNEPPMSVRFSALTRTVDFAPEKLSWSNLNGP